MIPCHRPTPGLRRRRVLGIAGLAALGPAFVPAARAQAGTLKIVVGYPAGATSDALARVVAEQMAATLKQTVIVDNRPGAAGAIGMQAVAEAKPDGYTLGLASDSAALSFGSRC